MKKFFALIVFLFCVSSYAASFITATVTITNTVGGTNGQTITINGNLRTWTNNVTIAQSQIPVTNSIGAAAMNLFNEYAVYPEAYLNITRSGTNSVVFNGFTGAALSAAVSSGWATLTFTTNSMTNAVVIRVPQSVDGQRTNNMSQLAQDLGNYSTSAIAPSTLTLNLVDTSTGQTVAGVKIFTSANIYSNASQMFIGGIISNVTAYLNAGRWTNGIFIAPTLTNGVNYGNAFSSPGGANFAEQFGSGASASGVLSLAVGANAIANADQATAIGDASQANGKSSVSIGLNSSATAASTVAIGVASASTYTNAIAIGTSANALGDNAIAIGKGSSANASNSIAIGINALVNTPNLMVLGGSSQNVQVPQVFSAGAITNGHYTGTNNWDGDFTLTRTNNSGLANGNNAAVNIADKVYVKVSGPTGAFTINGIAGGRDGRKVRLQNSTGQTWTIANDSGTDPTAANRIYTGTNGDVSSTNNPSVLEADYDGAVSRWVITSFR